MTESDILAGLQRLGIDASNSRLVLVLPLVQVAWADNQIQAAERERILHLAQEAGLLDKSGFERVDGWLTQRPSSADLSLGREILVALAHRQVGLGAQIGTVDLQRVRDLCLEVAASAGGLFGLVFSVSPEERTALDAIDRSLSEHSAEYLDLLPTPATGQLEEL